MQETMISYFQRGLSNKFTFRDNTILFNGTLPPESVLCFFVELKSN
jgi:hypothetical protein